MKNLENFSPKDRPIDDYSLLLKRVAETWKNLSWEKKQIFKEGSKKEKEMLTKVPESERKTLIEVSRRLGLYLTKNPKLLETSREGV